MRDCPERSDVRWVAAVIAIIAVSPAALSAQHEHVALLAEDGDVCGVCHGSHGTGSTTYTLKGGVEGESLTEAGGTPVSEVSASCLRCHRSPESRSRQPEFAAADGLSLTEGRFLSQRPEAEHPMGRVGLSDRGRVRQISPRGVLPRNRALELAGVGGRSGAAVAPPEGIRCTDCHDPHDRSSAVPEGQRLVALCVSCHQDHPSTLDAHSTLVCTQCHQMHRGSDHVLLQQSEDRALCLACHGANEPPDGSFDGLAPMVSPRHGESGGMPVTSCRDCHVVHD